MAKSTNIFSETFVDDVKLAKLPLIITVIMSAVYSILFLYFMSSFAEPLIKLCIVIVQVFFLVMAVLSSIWYIETFGQQEAKMEGYENLDQVSKAKVDIALKYIRRT